MCRARSARYTAGSQLDLDTETVCCFGRGTCAVGRNVRRRAEAEILSECISSVVVAAVAEAGLRCTRWVPIDDATLQILSDSNSIEYGRLLPYELCVVNYRDM